MQQERELVSFGWAIKRMLRDKANYIILEGFLTTLLGKEIKVKKFTKSESDKYPKDSRLDRLLPPNAFRFKQKHSGARG
jgi:hypothetical protein